MFTQSPASPDVHRRMFGFNPRSFIVLAAMLVTIMACATGSTPPDGSSEAPSATVSTTEEAGGASTSRPPTVSANDAPVSTQVPAVCSCREDRYNCSDFTQPGAAQECYQYCLVEAGSDVHLLDSDGNRVVCETVWPGWATPGGAPRATYTPFRIATSTARP